MSRTISGNVPADLALRQRDLERPEVDEDEVYERWRDREETKMSDGCGMVGGVAEPGLQEAVAVVEEAFDAWARRTGCGAMLSMLPADAQNIARSYWLSGYAEGLRK